MDNPLAATNFPFHPAQVYCWSVSRCLEKDEHCPQRPCPWGTVMCSGKCKADCRVSRGMCALWSKDWGVSEMEQGWGGSYLYLYSIEEKIRFFYSMQTIEN